MIHSPYTPFFGDAFMAAHGAIGVMLVALLWWTFPKANVARTLLFGAIALLVVTPLLGDFLRGFGGLTPPVTVEQNCLLVSSALVFAAMIACRRFALAFAAVLMAALLFKLERDWVLDSWSELCALHLIWVGVALGLIRRRAIVDDVITSPVTSARSFATQDVSIFVIATVAATLASIFVLSRADGSADEWAYTWQAAVFAKGHIYGTPPQCENAFQNFYVFESMGRLFAQYTPGWPMFMTPFVAFGVPWLAGPFSHGLMAVGIARVARSAVRLDEHGDIARERAAGWAAALVATFATTTLLVGASRYSHVFVAGLFAWAIEAMLIIRTRNLARDRQLRWGLVLGTCVAMMGAARPADGAALSVGIGFYYVYCLIRGRIGMRAFLGTLVGFVFFGALTLVILRVQLGEWFTTGYSLQKIIHPWAVAKYSVPKPNEWKFAMPLATGSYAWFPCALAVGAAGIASLRRGASGIIFILFLSFVLFDAYYQAIDLGRGFDWGYGPRYETPYIVHMAVGAGIAFAPLFVNARRRFAERRALYAGGPAAIVVCAAVVTMVRLWPLLYPGVWMHVHQHNSLNQRIRDMGIHHAIVMTEIGATGFDVLDLTENLPIDLYPNQDVLIAIDRKPELTQCVRRNFSDRAIYKASGNPVTITPF